MCFVAVHRRYAAGCVQVRVSCALPSLSLPLVVFIWSGLLAYMVLALFGFGFIVALFLLLVIAAARN